MQLQLSVLASGSSGNATYIATPTTRILIDAGLSAKQIELRLQHIGVSPASLTAICLSHEHSDHTNGARVLQKRYQLPLYANQPTAASLQRTPKGKECQFNIFQTGSPFTLGNLTLEPFHIPHDAAEPVGFRISNQNTHIGIVTDIGMVTRLVTEKLKGCTCLIIEANHDVDLLREAPRPWSLKQRIRSRQGHLSNVEAAQLICQTATDTLQHIILAHLSSQCNTPETVLHTIQSQLRLEKLDHLTLEVSGAKQPTPLWTSP
tara:strand:- start:811 stop:1596 length:786 start_codon:yes stop_codon:yes gene_type:complete